MMMHAPPFKGVTKVIVLGISIGFVLTQVLTLTIGPKVGALLSLSLAGLQSGYFHQIITHMFVAPGLMGTLFNVLLMWFIGSELEARWPRSFYVRFLMYQTLGHVLFYILASFIYPQMTPLMGIAAMVYGVLIAYGLIFSERTMLFMMIFPMKAKYFCALLVGIELYMAFLSFSSQAFIHLLSMSQAFIYLKFLSMRAQGTKSLAKKKSIFRPKKSSSHLKLVQKNDDDSDDHEIKWH